MFPTPQTPVQTALLETWFLLRNPKNWTRGTYARDADGNGVPVADPSAVCWCLRGAAMRFTNWDTAYGPLGDVLKTQVPEPGYEVGAYNDLPTTSHNDVLTLISRAYDHAHINGL